MANQLPLDETTPRDPEDRPAHSERAIREKNLDKTLADSFPTSDPPIHHPRPRRRRRLSRFTAGAVTR